MRILVAGASGMLGAPVVRRWRAAGHDVVRLVRRAPTAPGELQWNPAAGELDLSATGPVDAALDLAGAGVGDHRWSASYRRTILESRTQTTALLSRALAALEQPPAVLLQASATGFYGERGEEVVREGDAPGEGFLARVCVAWEAAAAPARAAGIRTVLLRTGLVLGPSGGTYGSLQPLLRLGVAGPLGSGRSWWSWISLEDELRAIDFLLRADVTGPVNLVAPHPARNGEVVAALAHALRRPAAVPAPAWALRAALGGFAQEVLSSRRVVPEVLVGAGFSFTHADLATAAAWVTASP